MSGNLADAPIPFPVLRGIENFGKGVALARRRRRFSQASMAQRIGISVASLRRLERGNPGISWATIARALHVLGHLEKLYVLVDASNDDIGLVLSDQQLPRRIRRKKSTNESGAL